jgi:hypothetical protein
MKRYRQKDEELQAERCRDTGRTMKRHRQKDEEIRTER